jgi:hypothetical protein
MTGRKNKNTSPFSKNKITPSKGNDTAAGHVESICGGGELRASIRAK